MGKFNFIETGIKDLYVIEPTVFGDNRGYFMETYNAEFEPYIKHLDGEIWELRPLKNRIMFFGYDGKQFVLLSHFIKKTQKTPKREIDKAKRLMKDYLERNEEK